MIRRQTTFLTNTRQLLISFHELVPRVDAISLDLNTPKFDHTAKPIIAHMAIKLNYLKSTFSDLS